jgi:hypothetical protein
MSGTDGLNITTNPDGSLSIFVQGQESTFLLSTGLTGYNRNNHTGYGNISLFLEREECTIATCDLTLGAFDYIPDLGGNAFFVALFALFLVLNIFLGIRHKTWGYMAAMVLGLIGEIIGYLARIFLHGNIFDPTGNNFLIYIVCLTIAPAFFAAAIYLCLGRIVVVYGESVSRFRPRTYTLIFCGCDILSLILQAAGGGMASSADTSDSVQIGINVMIAGLGFQVFSLVVFSTMAIEYAVRVYRRPAEWNMTHSSLYNSKRWHAFLLALLVATFTILVRSVFRVAELSGGFHGSLANNEPSFMVLEGAMIAIATGCLTVLHPGLVFQGSWEAANFKFKGWKGRDEEKNVGTDSQGRYCDTIPITGNGFELQNANWTR